MKTLDDWADEVEDAETRQGVVEVLDEIWRVAYAEGEQGAMASAIIIAALKEEE